MKNVFFIFFLIISSCSSNTQNKSSTIHKRIYLESKLAEINYFSFCIHDTLVLYFPIKKERDYSSAFIYSYINQEWKYDKDLDLELVGELIDKELFVDPYGKKDFSFDLKILSLSKDVNILMKYYQPQDTFHLSLNTYPDVIKKRTYCLPCTYDCDSLFIFE